MINLDEAIAKAMEYLSDSDIPLVLTKSDEFSEGWYFCFQSKEYVDTGNPSAQLAGNAPFLIDRETGELHVLGTAYPIEDYLDRYTTSKRRIK
jgi:hypothetical protein